MKYFALLMSSLVMILPFDQVKAESYAIDAGEVGYLMGSYMCKSLLTTGSLNDPEVLDEFSLEVVNQYTEKESEEFFMLMTNLISLDNIGDDGRSLELMRGAFSHIINDNDCFRAFLRESQGMGD